MGFSLRVYRSRSWIERALGAPTLDERFIFYWIALNSLYGRPKYLERGPSRTPEVVDLRAFLMRMTPDVTQLNIKEVSSYGDRLLRNRYLHEGTWTWSDTTADARIRREYEAANRDLARGRVDEYLAAVFARIYVLR